MVPISAVVALVLFLAFVQLADTYPSGAPPNTCLTLLPHHSGDPQSKPSPYRIEVNSRGNEVQSMILCLNTVCNFLDT